MLKPSYYCDLSVLYTIANAIATHIEATMYPAVLTSPKVASPWLVLLPLEFPLVLLAVVLLPVVLLPVLPLPEPLPDAVPVELLPVVVPDEPEPPAAPLV